MSKNFDPENDDTAEDFNEAMLDESFEEDEDDFDPTTHCVECGEPLSFSECTNPNCPENPDYEDDSVDLDA